MKTRILGGRGSPGAKTADSGTRSGEACAARISTRLPSRKCGATMKLAKRPMPMPASAACNRVSALLVRKRGRTACVAGRASDVWNSQYCRCGAVVKPRQAWSRRSAGVSGLPRCAR